MLQSSTYSSLARDRCNGVDESKNWSAFSCYQSMASRYIPIEKKYFAALTISKFEYGVMCLSCQLWRRVDFRHARKDELPTMFMVPGGLCVGACLGRSLRAASTKNLPWRKFNHVSRL